MKKSIFILFFLFLSPLFSQEIESVLKIKPEVKYDENIKYEEINKYKEENKELKLNYDFGIYLDVNRELMTIEGIKIDVGTNF
jgi:hypothetical protein